MSSAITTPVSIGENWWGIPDMMKSLSANAACYAMVDVMKIGGVTGWIKASALADAENIPLSSHLFQEVSAHLLPLSRTAHYLEYIDLAGEILQESMSVDQGYCLPLEGSGNGIVWDEDTIQRYEV